MKGPALLFPEIEDGDDVVLADVARGAGFFEEAAAQLAVGVARFRQDFQGDGAAQNGILRAVDVRHTAAQIFPTAGVRSAQGEPGSRCDNIVPRKHIFSVDVVMLLNYFDLNKRTLPLGSARLGKIERAKEVSSTRASKMPWWEQVLLYAGTVVGVYFSSAVTQFRAGSLNSIRFDPIGLGISAVVALLIIPSSYERLNIKPEAPLILRFGLFVQNGVFWHVLYGAISKAATS